MKQKRQSGIVGWGLGIGIALALGLSPIPIPVSAAVSPAAAISCRVRSWFSPHGGAEQALAMEIGRAKKIRAALYGLNNPRLVDALIAAHRRGVSPGIKLDKVQSAIKGQVAAIARLGAAGVKPLVSKYSRLLHDKFAVFDGRRVATGSYNWTNSAELTNRENLLILDCPDLARRFETEWLQIE